MKVNIPFEIKIQVPEIPGWFMHTPEPELEKIEPDVYDFISPRDYQTMLEKGIGKDRVDELISQWEKDRSFDVWDIEEFKPIQATLLAYGRALEQFDCKGKEWSLRDKISRYFQWQAYYLKTVQEYSKRINPQGGKVNGECK